MAGAVAGVIYVGCCAYAFGFGEMGICIADGLYVGPAERGTMGAMPGALDPAPIPAAGNEGWRGADADAEDSIGALGPAPGESECVALRGELVSRAEEGEPYRSPGGRTLDDR